MLVKVVVQRTCLAIHSKRGIYSDVHLEGAQNFIIGYRLSPEEIHGTDIGYTYKESLQLVEAIVIEELDYIHLSLWGGYDSKPEGADQSFGSLFKATLDDETKLIICRQYLQ